MINIIIIIDIALITKNTTTQPTRLYVYRCNSHFVS